MNTDSTNTPADFELHLQFAVPSERLFTALATLDGTKGWWTKFSEGFALLLCFALLCCSLLLSAALCCCSLQSGTSDAVRGGGVHLIR